MNNVNTFTIYSSSEEMMSYFQRYKILFVKGILNHTNKPKLRLNDLLTIQKLYPNLISPYTIENEKDSNIVDINEPLSSIFDFGYFSRIIQPKNNQDLSIHKDFINRLPISNLSILDHNNNRNRENELLFESFHFTDPVWLFIGRSTKELSGRKEHNDSVSHDGTFHIQCSGSKHWLIRPADTEDWNEGNDGIPTIISDCNSNRLKIEVEAGDLLVINTRAWFHETIIPATGKRGYSLSYARDFYYNNPEQSNNNTNTPFAQYTNVDTLYAVNKLKKNELIMREKEMYRTALLRSDNPSCEIGIMQNEKGKEEYVLLAKRDLNVGDFLTIAHSDDETSMEDNEEGEEEEV